MTKPWPEDHTEDLKAMHKDGLSAAEVANKLNLKHRGIHYSRNSVIGKLSRLGLSTHVATKQLNAKRNSPVGAPKVNPRAEHPPAKPKLSVSGNAAVFEQSDVPPVLPPVSARAWAPLPGSKPVTIMGLTPTTCRRPVDLAEATEQAFCGCLAVSGPYCLEHSQRSAPAGSAREHLDRRLGIPSSRRAA